MRRAARLLIAPLCLALPAAAQPALPAIQVPAQEKAPHKFLIRPDRVDGLCPDLLRAMERSDPALRFEGYRRELSLSLIEQGLKSGSVGAACALLERPERHAWARRADTPLYTVRHMVAVRADDAVRVDGLAGLRALSGEQPVLTARGSAYPAFLRAAQLKVDDATGDPQANLRKLLAGRARFFYGGEFALLRAIQANGLDERLRLLPTVFHEESIYFWVSRQLPQEQFERIERALARLKASGELARLVQQYQTH
jgi:glutamate/aspartate transport system substrate-binding protein